MAGNPLDAPHINAQVASDATWLEDEVYDRIKSRLNVALTNYGNTTQLTNAGITATTDQNQILALNIFMQNLIAVFEGTVTLAAGTGQNGLQAIAFLRGAN